LIAAYILGAEVTLQQALIGLVVSVPSVLLAYFGFRRSQKVDTIAQQAGIATNTKESIQQVIDGLNSLVDALQEDNKVLREKVLNLERKLDKVIEDCVALKAEVHDLSQQIMSSK